MNSEMNKHLKSCLSIKKNDQGFGAQSNNQVGEDIDIRKNLENLSSKRPDIFGGEGEKIKNKIGEKKEEKLVWDGQDPNITRGSGSSAMLAN